MSAARNRAHAFGIGIALAIALVALANAVGDPAWAGGRGASSSSMTPNVKIVKEDFFVANGTSRQGLAVCPAGTIAFGGGFASNGQHAEITVAGPARRPTKGYLVYAHIPPVNITTGVGKEIARITVVAYCAPVGQPVVMG